MMHFLNQRIRGTRTKGMELNLGRREEVEPESGGVAVFSQFLGAEIADKTRPAARGGSR